MEIVVALFFCLHEQWLNPGLVPRPETPGFPSNIRLPSNTNTIPIPRCPGNYRPFKVIQGSTVTLTLLKPHSHFGDKLLGNRDRLSPQRECGSKRFKKPRLSENVGPKSTRSTAPYRLQRHGSHPSCPRKRLFAFHTPKLGPNTHSQMPCPATTKKHAAKQTALHQSICRHLFLPQFDIIPVLCVVRRSYVHCQSNTH